MAQELVKAQEQEKKFKFTACFEIKKEDLSDKKKMKEFLDKRVEEVIKFLNERKIYEIKEGDESILLGGGGIKILEIKIKGYETIIEEIIVTVNCLHPYNKKAGFEKFKERIQEFEKDTLKK